VWSSIVISTGPIGGAPFPLIRVAPLIITWEKGPSAASELISCALPIKLLKRRKRKKNLFMNLFLKYTKKTSHECKRFFKIKMTYGYAFLV
jgi:hypothetical protein